MHRKCRDFREFAHSRFATRDAKPDGQCYVPPEKVCFKLSTCVFDIHNSFAWGQTFPIFDDSLSCLVVLAAATYTVDFRI